MGRQILEIYMGGGDSNGGKKGEVLPAAPNFLQYKFSVPACHTV